MEEKYRQAFSEVSCILKMMPEELCNNIPNSFKSFIEENKSDRYVKDISLPIEEQNLSSEAIAILAIIYENFLKDKFSSLNNCRDENLEKDERDVIKSNIVESNKQLIEVKKEKWYQKIFRLLKSFLRK